MLDSRSEPRSVGRRNALTPQNAPKDHEDREQQQSFVSFPLCLGLPLIVILYSATIKAISKVRHLGLDLARVGRRAQRSCRYFLPHRRRW